MWSFVHAILAVLVLLCQALVVVSGKQTEHWGESDLWKRSLGHPNFVGLSWSRGSASGQGGVGRAGWARGVCQRGKGQGGVGQSGWQSGHHCKAIGSASE